ncbi:ferrous iron transporter B [bacterium]|nr:ferrous iron transporter B [bacterium]
MDGLQILLMGNPNVGKSALFSRLTGINVVVANYPGTTVEFTKGKMHFEGKDFEVVDVPGTYHLEPLSKAEEVTCEMLKKGDLVINVVSSINLERSLNLTLQLLKKKIPMMIALNFWDEAKHTGIKIDARKLEDILGVPCVFVCAITGEGISELISRMKEAKIGNYDYEEEEKWHEVGKIVDKVETFSYRHHTFMEVLADATISPATGIPVALIILLVTFQVLRLIGEGLINYLLNPLFNDFWGPLMLRFSGLLGGGGIIHHLLIGELVDGKIDFGGSFGLLTTGLYVEFGAVFPYVFAFYVVISILEDSGYLPRLAILVDSIMHRLGLHGMGIIPMLLSLGCNVPGALSLRIMEANREKFIAASMIAIAVPCMAKTAMIIGLVGKYGCKGLGIVFGTLFAVWIALGVLLNRIMKGESMEIFLEIPPYRLPYFKGIIKKVWMRMVWFIKEATPWVLGGVLIANILYNLGIINLIGSFTEPVISGLFGLPKEAVGGLLIGFLRKDIAVGMLVPLNLTFHQMIVACVVLSMYFPCLATFTVLIKELGIKAMLKIMGIMFIFTLLVGGILNLVLEK